MASAVVSPQARAGYVKSEALAPDQPSVAQRIAGVLLAVPGVALVMSWLTAEALYPAKYAYSTHTNSLSNLGATEPPNSVVLQPSAGIFDGTLLVAGVMMAAAAFIAFRAFQLKRVSLPLALLGLGVFLVGVFPLTNPNAHTIVAVVAFFSGGIAMILASTIAPKVFRYIWMPLGVVSLVAITLAFVANEWGPIAALGLGGAERWNCYPIALWLIAFGSFLMTGPAVKSARARL